MSSRAVQIPCFNARGSTRNTCEKTVSIVCIPEACNHKHAMHESATVMRYAERPFSKNKNTQQEQVHANNKLEDMALSDGDANDVCCSYPLHNHTKMIQIVSIAEAF